MASSLVNTVTSELKSKIPGLGIVTGITGSYHQDNVLIKSRDILFNFLKVNPESFPGWENLASTYKLGHKDIPDRKLSSYDPEWKRLYDFIADVGGLYSPVLKNEILTRIPVFTAPTHATNETVDLMKNFMMAYPKGYSPQSTVPNMTTGDKNPLSLINKTTTLNTGVGGLFGSGAGSIAGTGSTGSTVTQGESVPETKTAGFLMPNMTMIIIAILALIVAFFLFR